MKKKVIFVIPTYNEKENLAILVEQISDLGLADWLIIVVDDNSPDGTGQLADDLSARYPLKVIHRDKKSGLGSAYRAGFRLALESSPDYILQMDADLSHETKYIPAMLEAVADYDLVIGSRYTRGGGTANWSAFRKFISQFANLSVKFLLRSQISDLTGGFKVFKKNVLVKVIKSQTSSIGYNFQIEVNILVEKLGYKIKEFPIVFVERTQGKSKFDTKIVIEGIWRVGLLAVKNFYERNIQNSGYYDRK